MHTYKHIYTHAYTEFYEKHEYRRYMVQLLLYVTQFDPYVAVLKKESENADKFVR